MSGIKINKLEIENVKRVKAVKMEPAANGLTIIGGDNNQGKTSVLDAIAWALGGDNHRPSQATREGSVIPPNLHIVLSNGLIVDRKGKNSSLKVTDPEGHKAGQQLLNDFIGQLAIDLPSFLSASNKKKCETLLQIIGVGPQLKELEISEQEIFNQRRAVGRIADQKEKYAKEMPYYPDAPKDLVSASDLIRQQQDILARNGENQRKRQMKEQYDRELAAAQLAFDAAKKRLEKAEQDALTATKSAIDLHDESAEELERNIEQIDEINRQVRINMDKDKAEYDALANRNQYDQMTSDLEKVRVKKSDLLKNANLPLPELSVLDGELTYKGQKWDNMSGSEQLMVATAIVRCLNPKCGFVLLDKLEQMDLHTLNEFGQWLEAEGLQAIATRVSTGEECSIIIQDGYSVTTEQSTQAPEETPKTTWKAGMF